MKIIMAVLTIGFLAWLYQLLTPVHPKLPEGVIVQHSDVLKHGIPLQLP